MRLLNVETLEFSEFDGSRDMPRYVTASHRWKAGAEAMITDIQNRVNRHTSGYQKVEGFASYIRTHISEVKWLWIDTCCVNQDSLVEVDEAVNSMFRWYSHAEVCLAFLADVQDAEDLDEFAKSEWFRRGWTLQELLAPHVVVFLSRNWQVVGHKGGDGRTKGGIGVSKGPSLEPQIASITSIPDYVLLDYSQSEKLTPEEKLAWIVGRNTTKSEDLYYSLLGIFGVRMRLSYGEGSESARDRLLNKVAKNTQQGADFSEIISWLSPPDPWSDHAWARQRCEPDTGEWMLRLPQYQDWKTGRTRHLCVYGKAGCGKTVLCSTLVEDVRRHCGLVQNSGYGIFYFSFSDNQKQSYDNLLRSLVAQLGCREPALSTLLRAYKKPVRRIPTTKDFERILLSATNTYTEVFLLLDALDEAPEDNEVRQNVLDQLERLSQRFTKCRILVTSREANDVHECMRTLKAVPVYIDSRLVDLDICRYVSKQLSQDRQLRRLEPATKALVEEHVSQKADGMFRWACCQLQELKKLKSSKPSYIKKVLRTLPRSLDDTYERMLMAIDIGLRKDALTLLRWLVYAQSPPTLGELREATVIDLMGDGIVDRNDRGSLEDALLTLSGLVTVDDDDVVMELDQSNLSTLEPQEINSKGTETLTVRRITAQTRLRLAHFSVQEYLESSRILENGAREFHLESAAGHQFLSQSCLTYLMHYSNSNQKSGFIRDFETFPLLKYAAQWWYYHSSLQQSDYEGRELSLLSSEKAVRDWLWIHQPDERSRHPFSFRFERTRFERTTSGLYYASYLGLGKVVKQLLTSNLNADAQGGYFGSALQAASYQGFAGIVQALLERGADANAIGGHYYTALQAASGQGSKDTVRLLLQRGADVNVSGGYYYTALQAASSHGSEQIVRILLDMGADPNAQGGSYHTALQAASVLGSEQITRLLLDMGADPNAQGGSYCTALQAASSQGFTQIARLLLDKGADIEAVGGYYNTALQAASYQGSENIVRLLINRGADVNASGGFYRTALQAASSRGFERIAQLLLASGADLDHSYYSTALSAAPSAARVVLLGIPLNDPSDEEAALSAASYATRVLFARIPPGNRLDEDSVFNFCLTTLRTNSAQGIKRTMQADFTRHVPTRLFLSLFK